MISGVPPIESNSVKPMDMSQVNTPLKVDSQTGWQAGLPGGATPVAIEERAARFEKLMSTDAFWNKLPSAQLDKLSESAKTDEVTPTDQTSTTEKQSQEIQEMLETLKKDLSPEEFKNLKEGWVGVDGTEEQLAQSYLLFMNEVVNQGTQIYNFLKDNLENP